MGSDDFAARDISSTFVKGLAVLKAFDDTRPSFTLSELSQVTGLDRASVRRLALTLVHLGYVKKEGRQLSLTPRVLVLAGSFLRGNNFGTHIQPLLNRFAAELGASISLAIPDDDTIVYVAHSTLPYHMVSFGFTVGSRVPLLHTALGRIALAFAQDPDAAKKQIQQLDFPQYTAETEMDRTKIAARVKSIQEKGYSVVSGEFEAGITGFAVPIGTFHNLQAAIGTSAPFADVQDASQQQRIITLLQAAARELSGTRLFAA
jgi:IclR family pca regulon transcriptional regulator